MQEIKSIPSIQTIANTSDVSRPLVFPKLTEAQRATRETIDRKVAQTQEWVASNFPGQQAIFLLHHAAAWTRYPQEIQQLAGEWIADIIGDVYPEYPLPNASAEFNARQIAEGGIHPYFIVMAPAELPQAAVDHDPSILLKYADAITPLAVTARVIGASDVPGNGVDELGRTARKKAYPGVKGGALVLQSDLDWELYGHSRAVIADVRAAAEHGTTRRGVTPSGGATQHLYYGELGLSPFMFSHAYSVGTDGKGIHTLEPFVKGEKRKVPTASESNRLADTIYVPAGHHADFVRKLSAFQNPGQPANVVEISRGDAEPYQQALAEAHGPYIYGTIVIDSGDNIGGTMPLLEAIAHIDAQSPEIIVQLRADTPESAATQQLFLDNGFVVCGFSPAYEEIVPGKRKRMSNVTKPATIYLARAGRSVREGLMHIAPAYFPPNLYGDSLQAHFVRIDTELRGNK